MKTRTIIAIAAVTAIITTVLTVPLKITGTAPDVSRVTPEAPKPALDHRLETWISALEWCESRGVTEALNPEDLDGTPSRSNFQWKTGTFFAFGKQYGLIPTSTPETLEKFEDLKNDYELQRSIVRHMARDPQVDLRKQFPDCINRKIGMPPKPSKTL